MYNQGTQAINHRRSVRTYSSSPMRSQRQGTSSQERVRLLQLAVCLVLFLAVSVWKGIFPQRLEQVRDDLLSLITADLDFQEALAELGESLAAGDTVLADLGAFCIEVFGAGGQDEPVEQVAFTPPPLTSDTRSEELRFLSQGADIAAGTIHYASTSQYGWEVTRPDTETVPVLEEPTDEIAAPEEAPSVPAVGTVIMVSDYSGEALPSNYTMDQLSLGELETVTPVIGHLNSEYGYRDHPINGRYQFHGGIDIGGQNGDPITAFAAGTVEYIGQDDSYGLYFQIDHGNGIKSFYAHCSKILVSKGQTVELGEKVAEVGSSGSATGPHLHLNPIYYVDYLEP